MEPMADKVVLHRSGLRPFSVFICSMGRLVWVFTCAFWDSKTPINRLRLYFLCAFALWNLCVESICPSPSTSKRQRRDIFVVTHRQDFPAPSGATSTESTASDGASSFCARRSTIMSRLQRFPFPPKAIETAFASGHANAGQKSGVNESRDGRSPSLACGRYGFNPVEMGFGSQEERLTVRCGRSHEAVDQFVGRQYFERAAGFEDRGRAVLAEKI